MFSRFGFRRRRHATKAYRVETPEGTTLNYDLEKAALGSELLEKILAAVDVQPPERRYFGLAVQEGGFMKWVLPNKQLKKQLAGHPPYLLHLRVHLYPRDHHSLQHYSSRHQLFLQVRRDLQENRLQCNTALTSQLAALVVQVDVGDFRSSTCGAGYLTEVQSLPRLSLQLQETVMQLHRINRGKSKQECEEEFLDLAQEQHSYGSHQYSVQDSSRNPVTLMASPLGLKVLRGPIETASFEWDSITKMASKGRALTVHISRTHTLASYNSGFSCASSHMAHHITHTFLGLQEFYCSGAVDRLEVSRLKRFFSSRRSMRRRSQPARRALDHPSTNPIPRRSGRASGRASGTTLSARRSSYSGALDGVLTFQQETSKPTAVNSPPQNSVQPSLDPAPGSALAPAHSRHSSSMDSSALHSRHDSTSLDSFAGTLGDETQAEVKGQQRPQAAATPPGPLPVASRLTDFIATPIPEEPVPKQPHAWYDGTASRPNSREHRGSTASTHSNPRHDHRGSYDHQFSSSSAQHEHQSNPRPYDRHSGSRGYNTRSHSGLQEHSGSYALSGAHNHSGSYDRSEAHDRHPGSHDRHPGSHDRHPGSHDRHPGSHDHRSQDLRRGSGSQHSQSGSYDSHSRAQDHRQGSGSRDRSSSDHPQSGSHDHRRSGSHDHRRSSGSHDHHQTSGSHDHHQTSGSHDHRHTSGSHGHRRNSGSYDYYSHRSTSQSPSEPRGPSPNPFPVPGRPDPAHPTGPTLPPRYRPPRYHPPPLHSVSQPNLDYYRPVHSRPPLPSGRGYNRPSSGGGGRNRRISAPSSDAPPSHYHNGTHPHPPPHPYPSHRRNDIHPHMHPSQYHNGTHHWPITEDTPSSLPPPPMHSPTRSTPPREEPWYAPSPPPQDTSTPEQPQYPASRKSRSLPPGVTLSLSQPPLPEMENMDSIVQFLDDSLGTGSQDSSPARPVRTIVAAARPQNRGQFRLSLQDSSYYDSKQQLRGQGRLKTIHGSQTLLSQGDLESSLKLGSIASMELQMSLAELSQASETCLDPHLRSIVFQSSQSQGTEL